MVIANHYLGELTSHPQPPHTTSQTLLDFHPRRNGHRHECGECQLPFQLHLALDQLPTDIWAFALCFPKVREKQQLDLKRQASD
jgi:hypothetical protein